MAISPDLSDPLDDTKGGDSLWGHWQQDKKEHVVLILPAEGVRANRCRCRQTNTGQPASHTAYHTRNGPTPAPKR